MSVIKKGLVISGGQMLFALQSMAVGILCARHLGPDGMGQFELFRTTRSLATTLFGLGLGVSAIYYINHRKVAVPQVATSIFKVSLLLWAGLTVLVTALVCGWPGYFGDVLLPVAALFAFGVGGNAAMCLLRPVLMARMEAGKYTLVNLAMPASLLVCGAVAALFGVLNTPVALGLLTISALSSLAMAVFYLRRDIHLSRPIDWPLLWRLTTYGVPLMACEILLLLAGTVTILLLRYLQPDGFEAVGLFTRATAIAALIGLVPGAVRVLLYSKWSGTRGEDRARQVEMAARTTFTFGVAVAVAIALCGRFLIVLLYGREFEGAVTALEILVYAMPWFGLSMVFTSLLSGDGQAGVVVRIMAGGLAIIIPVTWLLIPSLGIEGAAIGSLCGNVFIALAAMWQCAGRFGIHPGSCLLVRPGDWQVVRRILIPKSTGAVGHDAHAA